MYSTYVAIHICMNSTMTVRLRRNANAISGSESKFMVVSFGSNCLTRGKTDERVSLNIRPEVIKASKGHKTSSLLVKTTAVAIWDTDELANRSVSGILSNRYHGEQAKQRLTPKKLDFIKGVVHRPLLFFAIGILYLK